MMVDDALCGNPIFGDWGLSPRAEGARVVATPIGAPCLYCQEPIQFLDVGEMMQCIDTHGVHVEPVHRECLLLHTVGHVFGLCRCNGYEGLSERDAALEVARRVDRGDVGGRLAGESQQIADDLADDADAWTQPTWTERFGKLGPG